MTKRNVFYLLFWFLIVPVVGYLVTPRHEPVLRESIGEPQNKQSVAILYEECARSYSFPERNGRAVPVGDLSTKERDLLLQCALEVNASDLVRFALAGTKESLHIPVSMKFDGVGPLARVAAWANGKDAVDVMRVFLEPNDSVWRIDSYSAHVEAVYEASTIEAAAYLVDGRKCDEKTDCKKNNPSWIADNGSISTLAGEVLSKHYGLNPAQYQAFAGHLDVADYYIGKGVKLQTEGFHFQHWMLRKDKKRLLDSRLRQFLTRHRVSVDERDEHGTPLLHAAIGFRDATLVSELLDRGASPDIKDRFGNTPLHVAVASRNSALAKLVLAQSNLNSRNSNGRTPLHEALALADWDMAKALIENGARGDVRDMQGRTPIFDCARHGCPIFERLESAGSDLHIRDNAKNTLLFAAAEYGDSNLEFANKVLNLEAGVDQKNVDWKNTDGMTALHRAVQLNNIQLAQLLLNKGANVNTKDNLGNTPLHVATSIGAAGIVQMLLQAGANPDLANRAGVRPVNGEFERTQMLFHSPTLIRSPVRNMPRYFTEIRSGPNGRFELGTPTVGTIEFVAHETPGVLNAAEIELIPRAALLEFSVEQACELGAKLRDGGEILELAHLGIVSEWEEIKPLNESRTRFRATIRENSCVIATSMKRDLLPAISEARPASVEKWASFANACSWDLNKSEERCEMFVRPILRILVKERKEPRLVGTIFVAPDRGGE